MKVTRKLYLLTLLASFLFIALPGCRKEAPGCDAEPVAEEPEMDCTQTLVGQLRSADRLYATEYQVHKLVTYDDVVRLRGSVLSRKFDFVLPQGSRKVVIPMDAVLKAYIDFSGFGPENVKVAADSSKITVVLPDPVVEVTSTSIDHKGVREYVDFGRSRFSQKELSDFEKQGRAAIVDAIPQMNIVADARRHAYDLISVMCRAMGWRPDQIVVEYRKDFTPADYAHIIKISPQGL